MRCNTAPPGRYHEKYQAVANAIRSIDRSPLFKLYTEQMWTVATRCLDDVCPDLHPMIYMTQILEWQTDFMQGIFEHTASLGFLHNLAVILEKESMREKCEEAAIQIFYERGLRISERNIRHTCLPPSAATYYTSKYIATTTG